ncbi:MAG: GAF domain-containing protein [Gemmatimonadetes bacterium]|nr:GAF domain-containing protein [Gemmatimonadota bacterium]
MTDRALDDVVAALRVRSNLYAMLARTTRAVVTATDAAGLFADLCRTAVDTGEFRFAWVGVPDAERRVVTPVATAGEDGGYLARLVITLDPDDPRSAGPTGMAFRTGDAFVVNDFLSSPLTTPWHALAREVGFASSAAFPIRERGRVVAVLALYAGVTDFFTADLLETLEELASTVSLALDRFVLEAARRDDERALRMRDRALRAITQGIIIADAQRPDLPVVFVSPSFEALTGYRADEVLGRNCRFLQGPGTDPAALAAVRTALGRGEPVTVELRNYRKDGSPFWNALAISPVRDADGVLTHFIGVQTDVTARHRLEDQLRQAQRMEALGQLASGIAHDFNNLLTIINGASELALELVAPGDPSRELLDEALRAGERASSLTHQLLTFGRGQQIEPRVLDLGVVVADAERLLRRLIGADVKMAVSTTATLWPVLADPGQFQQVLVNLVVNARDAMPQGGLIRIETANVAADEVARVAPGARATDSVMLSVRDDGIGMDDDTRLRIFEPFFTTKPVGRGTGLGLATVHGIVLGAGGHVTVESAPGTGTTFRVLLPRVREAPAIEAALGVDTPAHRGSERVLLVEDDDAVRGIVAASLRRAGYEVLEAADGEQAIERSAGTSQSLALVIADVVLPGIGAAAFTEMIQRHRAGTRFLFLSGYSLADVARYGIEPGTHAFLQKPFTRAALLAKVRDVLDG